MIPNCKSYLHNIAGDNMYGVPEGNRQPVSAVKQHNARSKAAAEFREPGFRSSSNNLENFRVSKEEYGNNICTLFNCRFDSVLACLKEYLLRFVVHQVHLRYAAGDYCTVLTLSKFAAYLKLAF